MSATRMVFMGANREPALLPEECPLPEVGPGQVLVKITLATICASDLHTIQGRRMEAVPSVLGHEAVGEVVVNKRDDSNLQPGDRVTFSIISSCKNCTRCYKGVPQKCLNVRKLGHLPIYHNSGFNGCYASHILLDADTAIYQLPSTVPDSVAAPINCALATMVHALSFVPKSDCFQSAVVQGAGLLGVYACALLHDRGFSKIYAVDTSLYRLSRIEKFGATSIGPGFQAMNSAIEADSIDLVIEVCGVPDVLKDGLWMLRPGGMYILAGMVHPESHLDITGEQIIRKCLTIKGVHNYRPEDLESAVSFIERTLNTYPYHEIVDREFPLKDLTEAVKVAALKENWRVAVKP